MDRRAEFKRWKAQCLSKADFSRKGCVDEDVVEIVQLLNGREQFFTTSSCAGRIILLEQGMDSLEVQKQNCCWLLVSHKPCVKDDVIVALKKANGDAILKFEPLVLHVQCRQLQDAQILHSVAIDSGFRNSGITVGKRGKTMLAVRSTHGLEVPLSHKGKLMVTEEYIDFLLKIANHKMEENKKRIERFLLDFSYYSTCWLNTVVLQDSFPGLLLQLLLQILVLQLSTTCFGKRNYYY
ncbi:tRNA wybutosine-synthesizing protein 3 homolog isoform X1 [Sus scrofa]|uniref:tRNA wybutosine-synthesizing protein 3 homolog isoform X1 n=1 Tax=Sus scrofa TaxID=9823 RepID=UPI000A2B1A58|nr:tRNA wybutosine-synthesizing protein 3 homolog isoform X1 [Sus scrofa]